ncbi:pirin family protein [Luteimicrobium subarcticum]|uniref:Pirin n=1 Tax=Luteimicrobium subarcticum TaxID=620910 RepID=A0A2M8WS06_9MICO|nr:pirin family protein [Luteimicrobium subarcticum]PJI93730.1 hypothetical protein CLV34_1204 [Luteimicrobium subarcticum]
MSNLETRPAEEVCSAGVPETAGAVELLDPREVPLGGTRAMNVRRTLPQRARSLVGAWCFCDHYGPDDVTRGPGMQVPPHPHTGLQTVSWLFAGEILHRDSVGSRELVRPGQLNLMTAGRGISHSEQTPPGSSEPLLHGVQLWVALPSSALADAPSFEHHEDLPVLDVEGVRAHVLVGTLALADGRTDGAAGGAVVRGTSPATVHTPIVGAQLDLAPGAVVEVVADPAFEHAVLVDAGDVAVEGVRVPPGTLGYLGPGRTAVTVSASDDGPARAVLLGGEPFDEEIVMWWNFVGRSHDDVAGARADWQAGLVVGGVQGAGPNAGGTAYAADVASSRFGEVVGYDGGPLPAPVLPDVRLRPRRRS